MGTFDLVVFKVIWSSFIALVSTWPMAEKRLVIERNKVKFWNSEVHVEYF